MTWIFRTQAAELRYQCDWDITLAALPLQEPARLTLSATFPLGSDHKSVAMRWPMQGRQMEDASSFCAPCAVANGGQATVTLPPLHL